MDITSIRALLPEPYSTQLTSIDQLARLWAGYGYIYRLHLSGDVPSVILKYISPPPTDDAQDESTIRKLASYRVECNFYEELAGRFNAEHEQFQTPTFLARVGDCGLLMTDLALTHPISGEGRGQLEIDQSLAALRWFAAFHSHWYGYEVQEGRECPTTLELMRVAQWEGKGVWSVGTYNHLTTRLDELAAISPSSPFAILRGPLAFAIEYQLQHPRDGIGRTLVHGDAKAANLACRRASPQQPAPNSSSSSSHYPSSWNQSSHEWQVSMYDFQYVGVGVPTQDLIKFLATAVPSRHLRNEEDELSLLRFYYDGLQESMREQYDWNTFQHHWKLSLLSWVRFTQGWGSWGNTRWLERRARDVLEDQKWVEEVMRVWESSGRWGEELLSCLD